MSETPTTPVSVSDSILASTKKILGIADADTSFDLDVMTHINAVFDTLNQLGAGPPEGFMIEDREDTWAHYFGDRQIPSVKSYMYLRVRLLFDPPSSGFAITAQEKQIKELESRINMIVDNDLPDLDPVVVEDDPFADAVV